jgi:hypothetical protein
VAPKLTETAARATPQAGTVANVKFTSAEAGLPPLPTGKLTQSW